MKERPILFNGEMVRAILAGKKTQTRRIIKPQPNVIHAIHPDASITTNLIFRRGDQRIHCPFGTVGDRLWVREAFAWIFPHEFSSERRAIYRANYRLAKGENGNSLRWYPSIHMPRCASRITLEIVSVRVERLQDISEADARAEGMPPSHPSVDSVSRSFGYPDFSRSVFAQTWNFCYGDGAWEENPFVWVVEFKRVKD